MTPKRFHYFFLGGLSLFCLVAIVVGYGFFLGVLRASDDLIVANNSDDQLETRITALQKLSNSMQNLVGPLQHLHEAIPQQKDVPGLVANLEATANSTGVTISDLDFSAAAVPTAAPAPTPGAKPAATAAGTAAVAPAKPAGPTPLPFKMEAVGSYAQMTNFLSRLTRLPRYVEISQLSLVKPHKEADQVDITFLMNAYVE